MRRTKILSLFFLASLLVLSCNGDKDQEAIDTGDRFEFTKEGELSLINPEGDTLKKIDIEIADNTYERETGLMHRESMEEHQGMLFIFNSEGQRSFYMKNTLIPLDIIYYSGDSTAVKIYENTTPMDETSLPSEEPAQYVLEINAGLVNQWGIALDDKIYFERTD